MFSPCEQNFPFKPLNMKTFVILFFTIEMIYFYVSAIVKESGVVRILQQTDRKYLVVL